MTAAPVAIPQTELRWLVDAYSQTQKLRIQIGNRLDAVSRAVDLGPVPARVGALHGVLLEYEKSIHKDIEGCLKDHPAMPWLGRVKGIGPALAGKILGLIGSVEHAETASQLWRFAGYAVIDGRREYPVKGQKLTYNRRLKTTVYLCGVSFLKSRSPYRDVYDRVKARREVQEAAKPTDDQWSKGHIHLHAMRVMGKVFLSHLWETWRTAEGLPIRKLFVEEKLGHTGITDPWDFVVEAKAA